MRLAGPKYAAAGFGDLTPIQKQFFKYVTAPSDRGGVWQFTDQGGALVDGMLSQFADAPTAFAMPSADGDVVITWYAGYLVPPAGSEPGPYFSMKQLMSQVHKPGMVHLIETDIINPRQAKRAVVFTQNPVTVAKLAMTDSPNVLATYAVDSTANPNVIGMARMIGPPKVQVAGVHFGLFGLAIAAVAGLALVFSGGKKKGR